ncbi:MAG TPA: FG-GAP repeat protein [Rudaea sp.]|nr:FG-GAP repeat protein [Rudaea sp.]
MRKQVRAFRLFCGSLVAAFTWIEAAAASQTPWNEAISYDSESITVTPASGQPSYFQQAELGLPQPGDSVFGSAVAQWKDTASGERWAVIGAPGDDGGKGAVYVFELSPGARQWHQFTRIIASDGAASDAFGSAVAIDGNTIAVGAPNHTSAGHPNSGQAYVYTIDFASSAVNEQARIYAAASDNAQTGTSVALAGDKLLIGAPNASTNGAVWFAKRSGTSWTYTQALFPFGTYSGFTFGKSLSIDGTRILISMPNDSSSGDSSGLAFTFIYDGSAWNQEQRIAAPDAVAFNHFGSAVALRGNTAAVGARDHNAKQGAVYSFLLIAGWTYESTLSVAGSKQFGYAVSLTDGMLAVGATEVGGADGGQSYLFSGDSKGWAPIPLPATALYGRLGTAVSLDDSELLTGAPDYGVGAVGSYGVQGDSWSSQANLHALDVFDDRFGSAVAISADTAVVDSVYFEGGSTTNPSSVNIYGRDPNGAWQLEQSVSRVAGDLGDINYCPLASIDGDMIAIGDPKQSFGDTSDSDKGAAYIYKKVGKDWVRDAVLIDFSGNEGDEFGCSVSTSGNTVAVGSPRANGVIGAVYLFVKAGDAWTLQQRLSPSDGAVGDIFGVAVAVSGDTLVIGSPYHGNGTAYLYKRSGGTWSFQHEITASDGMAGDHFGAPLAISGTTLAIGAPRKNPDGGVYIYTVSGTSTALQQQLDGPGTVGLFGISLGLYGNQLVVGAAETAHVYNRRSGSWSPRAIMDGNSSGTFFGGAVGVAAGNIIATDFREGGGRAYIFQDDRIFADGFD